MRVFVAGATGAIGRPLVTGLLAAGHEVTGMTRSPERAARLRAAGAESAVVDAYDRDGVQAAVAAARPEVVIAQLTALSGTLHPRRYGAWMAETSRLRAEATPLLLAAARAAGARRFVAQSVCFLLAPEGPRVVDETARDARDAPAPFGPTTRTVLEMEREVVTATEIEGLVLRYGFFWGPGTSLGAGGQQVEEVRRRRLPVVGSGDGRFSFVHVEDAARATMQALEHGAPGIYNVADDEPARQGDWVPALAAGLGAPPPRHVPRWLARLVAGPYLARMAEEQRGSSNAKARHDLAWAPEHGWREGFAAPALLGLPA